MKLSELLKSEGALNFSAVKMSECDVTREHLLRDIPKDAFVIFLCVAYPYLNSPSPAFASFARLPDYHLFFSELGEKAKALISEKYSDRFVKGFADTSPFDERKNASRLGLGVIGDNGLLLVEGCGAFVFIGEIVLSLDEKELEAEGIEIASLTEPLGCSHCGKCSDVCPAGCVGGDKSLCVSNLTQKKGDLSDTEKSIIKKSGYAWGCDKCASVCPYYEKSVRYPKQFTENILPSPTWEDIEAMEAAQYKKYPFSWRKKELIRRNFGIFKEKDEEAQEEKT